MDRNGSQYESYRYDYVGNRGQDPRANDYVYDNLNRLVSGNGVSYQYDANGNRTEKTDASGTTRYRYNSQNQLIHIDFPDQRRVDYAYDPLGRRIEKRLTAADGTQTLRRYGYDGANLLLEQDETGQPLNEFLSAGLDEPLLLKRNGQVYRYISDAQGSIIALSDSAGQIVQRYEYDAYGKTISVQDPAFVQPYGYTGRERDDESGLYYYRARYYDPAVGRFLQSDPIGLAGGINTYAYVLGDPVNLIDPDGLHAKEVAPSGGGYGGGGGACGGLRGLFSGGSGRTISETLPQGITRIRNAQGDVFKEVHTPPSRPHAGMEQHTHPNYRNVLPDGSVRTGVSKDANPVSRQDIIDATRPGAQRTGGK